MVARRLVSLGSLFLFMVMVVEMILLLVSFRVVAWELVLLVSLFPFLLLQMAFAGPGREVAFGMVAE